MPITLYDELGENKFRDFVLELLYRVYGSKSLIPYPSKGMDRGIDAKKIMTKQSPTIYQFKFREVARWRPDTLQRNICKEFEKWTSQMQKNNIGSECVFITNVALSAKTHISFETIIKRHEQVAIEYWEFEKLNTYLKQGNNVDLYDKFFPRYSREQYNKLMNKYEQVIDRKKVHLSKRKIKHAQIQFQRLFIDINLKYKYYYAFIDLLEPFYLDKKDEDKRKKLRELFKITQAEEQKFINDMAQEGLVKIVGDICITNDQKKAVEFQKEIIEKGAIGIETILKLFA